MNILCKLFGHSARWYIDGDIHIRTCGRCDYEEDLTERFKQVMVISPNSVYMTHRDNIDGLPPRNNAESMRGVVLENRKHKIKDMG